MNKESKYGPESLNNTIHLVNRVFTNLRSCTVLFLLGFLTTPTGRVFFLSSTDFCRIYHLDRFQGKHLFNHWAKQIFTSKKFFYHNLHKNKDHDPETCYTKLNNPDRQRHLQCMFGMIFLISFAVVFYLGHLVKIWSRMDHDFCFMHLINLNLEIFPMIVPAAFCKLHSAMLVLQHKNYIVPILFFGRTV